MNLQTLLCLFFSLAFLFIAYLVLPLLLPRPQIKRLGTLLSLPIYLSAKFKQYGQTSFSNLLQKLKHGMIQIELLDHPSKLSEGEALNALFPFLKIWDLCLIKAEHIWHVRSTIMKYETYCYRWQTPYRMKHEEPLELNSILSPAKIHYLQRKNLWCYSAK